MTCCGDKRRKQAEALKTVLMRYDGNGPKTFRGYKTGNLYSVTRNGEYVRVDPRDVEMLLQHTALTAV